MKNIVKAVAVGVLFVPIISFATAAAAQSVPTIVQSSPVAAYTSAASITATLPGLPATGDTLAALVELSADAITAPTGWTVRDDKTSHSGFATLTGVVGQNGLVASKTYTFGTGQCGVAQVFDISGAGSSIAVSSDIDSSSSPFARTLTIPSSGGLLLSTWGGWETASGSAWTSITDSLPSGQSATVVGSLLNSPLSSACGGGTFALQSGKVTSEPYSATQPFTDNGQVVINSSIDKGYYLNGQLIWLPSASAPVSISAPTGLTAAAVSSSEIDLGWIASTGNTSIAGYEIWQNGTLFGTTTAQTFAARGLTQLTTYSFTVRAYDAAGDYSAFSQSVSATTTDGGAVIGAATLGAHSLAWLPCGGSAGTLSTPSMTTQSSGSTMLVWVGRGTKNNFSNSTIPTDTAGSTYSMIGTVHDYSPLWPGSGEALYASPFAKGGLNDRVSTQQSTQDEITLAAVEVKNGGSIADAQWNEVLSGSPNTSANVTVNGPATLVAVWAGDGDADPMTAVPNNGFQVIDSQLVNTTCAVQTVIAAKEVSASGTYNVTWTATPTQGAHMWLVAVQSAQPQAPDTTPPSAPSNLAATAASQTQINLTWSAATDNVGVTGYQVFRNGSPTPVTTTTATSFNDSGLVASTTYSYTVKAFDAAGNVSGVSNTAVAVTSSAPDTTPPTVTITAPTGILPAGTATTTLAVTTNENATCAYATTPNTAFGSMALFTGTGGMSHSTTLAGLSNGGAYTYYVKCKDAAGNISNDSSTSFSVALPVSGALSQSNLLTQMIKENKNVTLSATTAQFTPPANSFLVANVVTVDNQSIGTQTLSGGGLTWTRQKTFTSPNKPSGYTFTQEVWTAPVSTSAPMSITVAGTGKSGSDPARVNIQVLAFSNYNTAAPIGATASGSSLGSGAATITLSSAPAASSIVVAARGVVDNNTLDSTATPGAGWTEVFDQATSGGYGDLETMVRTGSTATGVTWNDMADPANASLFESSAFALEIKAATS